jgi:hypothetical protein
MRRTLAIVAAVHEIAPGIFHWTAVHRDIGIEVSSYYVEPAGLLVDPLDIDALARGLEQAAALPCPNLAAREATAEHDVRRQAERIEAILSRAAALDPRS